MAIFEIFKEPLNLVGMYFYPCALRANTQTADRPPSIRIPAPNRSSTQVVDMLASEGTSVTPR